MNSSTAIGSRGSKEDAITFEWETARRSKHHRLFLFILLSAFIHFGFFYLFRVANEVRETPVPRPQSITLLHPNHSLAAPFIERLIDRATATSGSFHRSASSTLELTSFTPTYTPSYASYEPQLRPFPEIDRTDPLPSIFHVGAPKLPPVIHPSTDSPVITPPSVQTITPTLTFSPSLQPRVLGDVSEDWRSLIPPNSRHTYSIAVDPAGRITHLLAIPSNHTLSAPPIQALQSAIRALRFAPHTTTTSGTLTITQ